MKRRVRFFEISITLLLAATIPSPAYAHANLVKDGRIKPRDNSSPLASKKPAGVVTRYDPTTQTAVPGDTCGETEATPHIAQTRDPSQPVTALTGGQTITLNWVETFKHTGWFQIWFSPNGDDTGFMLIKDHIPQDPSTGIPTPYSTQITIPNVSCDNCVIRLNQVMLDMHPDAPTYYYSCANVTITPGPPPTGGSGSSGGSGDGCN